MIVAAGEVIPHYPKTKHHSHMTEHQNVHPIQVTQLQIPKQTIKYSSSILHVLAILNKVYNIDMKNAVEL